MSYPVDVVRQGDRFSKRHPFVAAQADSWERTLGGYYLVELVGSFNEHQTRCVPAGLVDQEYGVSPRGDRLGDLCE
jgi:hypothetical protein